MDAPKPDNIRGGTARCLIAVLLLAAPVLVGFVPPVQQTRLTEAGTGLAKVSGRREMLLNPRALLVAGTRNRESRTTKGKR